MTTQTADDLSTNNLDTLNEIAKGNDIAKGSSPPSPPKKGKRGMAKGQTNAGSFKKGYDPRRQTPITFKNGQHFRQLCRTKTPEMLEIIIGFARDEDETTQNRYNAAKYVIEQGYGKPTTPVAVATDGEDITKYSAQQIDNAIAAALGMDTIDGECVQSEPVDTGATIEGEAVPDKG